MKKVIYNIGQCVALLAAFSPFVLLCWEKLMKSKYAIICLALSICYSYFIVEIVKNYESAEKYNKYLVRVNGELIKKYESKKKSKNNKMPIIEDFWARKEDEK